MASFSMPPNPPSFGAAFFAGAAAAELADELLLLLPLLAPLALLSLLSSSAFALGFFGSEAAGAALGDCAPLGGSGPSPKLSFGLGDDLGSGVLATGESVLDASEGVLFVPLSADAAESGEPVPVRGVMRRCVGSASLGLGGAARSLLLDEESEESDADEALSSSVACRCYTCGVL